jgi:hypothetical protein
MPVTGNTQQVADLARGIFWLVLASLPLFALLRLCLEPAGISGPAWLSPASSLSLPTLRWSGCCSAQVFSYDNAMPDQQLQPTAIGVAS